MERDGNYACLMAVCGRPFLVEGAQRQSELSVDATWLERSVANAPLAALDEASRTAIAQHFAEAGLMEHASIAAFARFALQLLALGAPPELVADATRAMADETRHARVCFALASRYAGRDLGPGPLEVAGALGVVDLLEVVELVVAEGCLGETTAALEAAWAAEGATDPAVREALGAIAEDEARHAALALRFVAWAATRDARVPERVERQLERARAVRWDAAALPAPNAALLAAHGVIGVEQRRDARRTALDEILPAVLVRARGSQAHAPDRPSEVRA
jgi:hypothetical protein